MAILGFYSSGEPEIEELLDGSLSVKLRIKSARFFQLFLGCRGVNEEDCPLLSRLYCESLQNTSSLHFAMILNRTIACLHTLFQELIILRIKTLVLRPTRSIVWLWPRKRLMLQTLKIRTKSSKIAITILFS